MNRQETHDRQALLDFWQQPDRQLRKVAVQMVLDSLPASWDVCLDMLIQSPETQVGELVGPLRRHMPFLKTGYRPADGCTTVDCQVFSRWQHDYQALTALLTEQKDHVRIKTCYRLFDGLRPDLLQLFPDIDFTNCQRDDEEPSFNGRQLMVFVTGQCNLHCSYCFSNDMVRRSISPENLHRIFDWAAANGCSIVTPCGGEPLLYQHIRLFMDLVASHGMSTYFASNCTLPLSQFTPHQLDCVRSMSFHMTESLWERPDYMRTFCENIETAQHHDIDIIARGNIITPDQDLMPWFELADRYGLKRMNIALTIPSGSHDNTYIDTTLFSDFVPVIRQCIDLCRQRAINLSFAKPIPPCVFDAETAGWLLQYDNFAPMCNVHEDQGTRNVCLSPDMMFTPCLGVPRPEVPFSEELTWQDLYLTMGREIDQALQKPLFAKCSRCFLYDRKLCQGACLSYKYLSKA